MSLAYYRDALGFDVTFVYGEPSYYPYLCRKNIGLHLIAATHTKRLPGHGAICLFVENVDVIHDELAARGAKVLMPPRDYAYGMRDFNVADLDGNRLIISMGSKS